MHTIVFHNRDTKAIRSLLKEIGEARYNSALMDEGITQPPITMNGFFLEFDTKTNNLSLFHRYPSHVTLFIMSVLGYWSVPNENWIMVRKENK
ncbi:hypothetical protein [Kriegella aquimaris]|uniref:Uncharacterized protein n=1 Tax=Kriegella aquimaris TaxID=192904 RepID=A0A1G9V0J2_9FLAO|nr:hypothetical protein [Kriegella aquimaris]SDM65590.1 hypothetical protein SAMN04488514_11256 [Kriegella aquimaris]